MADESQDEICWSVLKTLQINGFDVSDMMDHVVSVYHQETVCCLFPGSGASPGPPGPPGASSGPRSPLRDYQFMKCDNSEMLRQRPSCCLTMQVSGSSSSGRHPPSSLWILISTIIWQVRHKHTHRESGGVFSPGALSWGLLRMEVEEQEEEGVELEVAEAADERGLQ